jgi:hypothetical protein
MPVPRETYWEIIADNRAEFWLCLGPWIVKGEQSEPDTYRDGECFVADDKMRTLAGF